MDAIATWPSSDMYELYLYNFQMDGDGCYTCSGYSILNKDFDHEEIKSDPSFRTRRTTVSSNYSFTKIT